MEQVVEREEAKERVVAKDKATGAREASVAVRARNKAKVKMSPPKSE